VKRFAWFLVAGIGLLASCRGTEPSAPAKLNPGEPRLEEVFDCEMDISKCTQIRAAIQALQSHPAQVCRDVGAAALSRYDAPPGSGRGFRDGTDSPDKLDDAYVEMVPGSSVSGWVPADGYIYLTPSSWSQGYGTGIWAGKVAHEEGGHQSGGDDPWHNTGAGYYLENSCGE
jgi:hypothetical protein